MCMLLTLHILTPSLIKALVILALSTLNLLRSNSFMLALRRAKSVLYNL